LVEGELRGKSYIKDGRKKKKFGEKNPLGESLQQIIIFYVDDY